MGRLYQFVQGRIVAWIVNDDHAVSPSGQRARLTAKMLRSLEHRGHAEWPGGLLRLYSSEHTALRTEGRRANRVRRAVKCHVAKG